MPFMFNPCNPCCDECEWTFRFTIDFESAILDNVYLYIKDLDTGLVYHTGSPGIFTAHDDNTFFTRALSITRSGKARYRLWYNQIDDTDTQITDIVMTVGLVDTSDIVWFNGIRSDEFFSGAFAASISHENETVAPCDSMIMPYSGYNDGINTTFNDGIDFYVGCTEDCCLDTEESLYLHISKWPNVDCLDGIDYLEMIRGEDGIWRTDVPDSDLNFELECAEEGQRHTLLIKCEDTVVHRSRNFDCVAYNCYPPPLTSTKNRKECFIDNYYCSSCNPILWGSKVASFDIFSEVAFANYLSDDDLTCCDYFDNTDNPYHDLDAFGYDFIYQTAFYLSHYTDKILECTCKVPISKVLYATLESEDCPELDGQTITLYLSPARGFSNSYYNMSGVQYEDHVFTWGNRIALDADRKLTIILMPALEPQYFEGTTDLAGILYNGFLVYLGYENSDTNTVCSAIAHTNEASPTITYNCNPFEVDAYITINCIICPALGNTGVVRVIITE